MKSCQMASQIRTSIDFPTATVRKCSVVAIVVAAGLLAEMTSARAQPPPCSQSPSIFAWEYFQALTMGTKPSGILTSGLSRLTSDSISPNDVERIQSELNASRGSRGRAPFFKGPIIEDVDKRYIQNLSANAALDYVQIAFIVESGDESGLSRLTLLLHCINPDWYVAGIRLAPAN
jgi:hypothetical protein